MRLFEKHKTIEDILPFFLLEKETGTNLKTSQAYNTHIYTFITWLKQHNYSTIVDKITEQQVADFFNYIAKERELDRPTCERYLIHLKALFTYAAKRKIIRYLPINLIVMPKKKMDRSAQVIRTEDLKPLLVEIEKRDPQLYLACMFEYYCFIRPGKELRLMKVGDIDLTHGTITVREENAKNKRCQQVTIPQQLIDLCIKYGFDKADKGLYIMGNKKTFGTKPLSINMLRYRFNIIRKSLGLPEGYKLYSMKHSGATALHMSGLSLRELMDQLRHSHLQATEHYVKTRIGEVNTRIRDNFPSPV